MTDGGFAADGTFCVLPKVRLSGMEQLFRHRVLKMMLREGLINQERVRLQLSWRHSGFNVDGSVRVRASDAKGRENISRYLIRNFQVYDPLDFLAAVTAHIPDKGEHLVRYYGWYSSVQRGRRRKLGLEEPAEAAAFRTQLHSLSVRRFKQTQDASRSRILRPYRRNAIFQPVGSSGRRCPASVSESVGRRFKSCRGHHLRDVSAGRDRWYNFSLAGGRKEVC